MKIQTKLLKTLTATLTLSLFAFSAQASDLSGTYHCSGYDSHDGYYDNAVLTLTSVPSHSYAQQNLGAYRFDLVEDGGKGTHYTGEAAANGNDLAIYFSNVTNPALNDSGVGIAHIAYERNKKGAFVKPVLTKFYYEPTYATDGSDGTEKCVQN